MNHLKEARKKKNISQTVVCEHLGVTQGTVSQWETGVCIPSVPMLLRLSEYYGTTVDYLLGRTDNPLSVISENTPYEQITPFERQLLTTYRKATEGEQVAVCRVLGVEHPAEARIRAKKAL